MTVYKVSELAVKLGMKPKNLYTYKGREKIIIENGNIDDSLPLNAVFIKSRLAKIKATPKAADVLVSVLEQDAKKKRKKTTTDPLDLQLNMELSAHEKLRNKKLFEEIEIARIRKEKLLGKVLPTDAVFRIFNIHFKNVSVEFYNAIDSYSTVMIKKIGGNRKDLSEIRVTLKEMVNDFIGKAKIKSKEDIEAIIREFSDKKTDGKAD